MRGTGLRRRAVEACLVRPAAPPERASARTAQGAFRGGGARPCATHRAFLACCRCEYARSPMMLTASSLRISLRQRQPLYD
jgi:hypothetical protein